MTATDPLATPDAVALIAAIDAGEDDHLQVLADLLEEASDPRAAGLRQIVRFSSVPTEFRPDPHGLPSMWNVLYYWTVGCPAGGLVLTRDRAHRMGERGIRTTNGIGHPVVAFSQRSAAYLALAEALVAVV